MSVAVKQDDEIDLSRATLFADSALGVYIPKYFAEHVRRDLVTGVSNEDYNVLLRGPEHPNYWDAWADVIDNAKVNDPKLGACFLHQDGDLWVVPVEVVVVVLGHTFREFTRNDWDSYAGAEPGSLICHDNEDFDLIWDPKSKTLSEIRHTMDPHGWQRDWKFIQIAGEEDK